MDGTDTLTNVEIAQFALSSLDLTQEELVCDEGDPIELRIEQQLGAQIDNFSRTGADVALGLYADLPFANGDLSDGFFLSTGGFPGASNTATNFTVSNGTPGDGDLGAVATSAFSGAGSTRDAALVEFTIDIPDPDVDGIAFDLVFGSDEFPEFSNSSFVDVGAIFVNGANVALFNNDPSTPLSVIDANVNQGNFIDNGSGAFPTELDGFSQILTVRAPLQQGENTIKIGIADTGDSAFDSAMFLSNLSLLSGGAAVGGVLTVVDDEDGDSVVQANTFDEEINLATGQDTVQGSAEALDGDVITGFGDDDTLKFTGANFSNDNFTVTLGSAIIAVDSDLDGEVDSTVVLEGDFEDAVFTAEAVGDDTEITFSANAAPVASAGAASGDEDTAISGALTATDVDGDALTFALAAEGDPSNGAVAIAADGSFTYTPAANFNGEDQFTYEVSDGTLTDTAVVTITVNPVNDAPVAAAGAASGDEDTAISGALSASDIEGDALTFALAAEGDPSSGDVAIAADGSFTYTPAANFNGEDQFTYEVSDGGQTDTATVTITVNPVNDAPVASAGAAAGDAGEAISGDLAATDIDGDALTYALAAEGGPQGGDVVIDPAGGFSYTSRADFDGLDQFTFVVTDPGGLSAAAVVSVDVTNTNLPTDGADTVEGTSGNDRIDALGGDDLVFGRAGDDVILGRAGDDRLRGNGGDDTLRGNGGADNIKGNGGSDNIKGNGGGDNIRAGGGSDVVRAGGGSDTVKGGGGGDRLDGGGGADLLEGGGGADVLIGKGGADTLKGGGGRDTFQFRANDRNDVIEDFQQGFDRMEILSGASSFADIRVSQDGEDAIVAFGAARIRLEGETAGAIDESDFIFS